MWETQHSNVNLGLFQDSDFAGDLEDSKSTSGRVLMHCSEVTPLYRSSWMCKKQTSVSHGSTEAQVISLDASLRMDGDSRSQSLRDLAKEVFDSSPNQTSKTKDVREPREKPVGKNTNKHAKTNSNHEHQSRSEHHDIDHVPFKCDTFWFQCYVVCL